MDGEPDGGNVIEVDGDVEGKSDGGLEGAVDGEAGCTSYCERRTILCEKHMN